MIGRATSLIGLAVADRAVTCAEVAISGGRRTARRTATFMLPADLTLEKPEALGQALAAFLKQNRFGSNRAVVGISARWLMAVEREVPPADQTAAHAALRLLAERLAVAESGELVFDYVGRTSETSASKVLLVGTLRQRLEQIEKVMAAAGLGIVAVTSSGLALASAAETIADDSSIVLLTRGGAEMIWRSAGEPRMLRHVSLVMNGHGTPPIAPLSAEIKRAVNLARTNGQAPGELLLLNGVGLAKDDIGEMSERIGLRIRSENGAEALGVATELSPNESDPAQAVDQYAPAMALALAGADPGLLPLDFRHSRLAPPQPKRIDRRTTWGIVIGVLVLLLIGALYWSVHQQQSELDQLKSQSAAMKDDSDKAQAKIDRVRLARNYFDQRPAVLEGLRQVTMAFHDDERIWVTNFSLRENGKGQIIGKASESKVIFAVRDRLQSNPRFKDVTMVDMRDTDTRSRDIAFSISFNFIYTE